MKSIYIKFSFLILMAFSSCDKALEEEPQNKLKPETISDYVELLNYGYPTTKDYGTIVALDYYVEMMTDDQDIRYLNTDRGEYPLHPFTFESTHEHNSMFNGYDQAWKNLYKAIYYANVVVDNVEDANGNAAAIAYTKGEAMALRAFSYFKLINLYAAPYNESTASIDLGVPLKLDPTVKSESYTRNSVQEIYDQINADLEMGIQLMTNNDQRITSKFKLTPVSANLLASRVALYQKKYEDVISYADRTISLNNNLFDISNNSMEFAQTRWGYGQGVHYFNDANDNVLFKYGSNEMYYYVHIPGALAISDDLISLYEPGDLRLYYFTYVKGSLGRVYFKFRPFPNRLGEPTRGFRVEEAFLNRAEAYALLGQPDNALEDLNTIRKTKFDASFILESDYYKYSTTTYDTQEKVVQVVKDERRRELFGEFHRWYDLRRYGMPEITHTYDNETYTLSENDPRYILQIPQIELDYNPSMQRNPR
ncbi:RagB/SusD family nutrient uptake outer membrane protein [Gelidibacter salicanalis]|uniref:RagB/SusD family nutrient uptake outer membrane protein n=1 Tax=Gelidibacter salicanalis TaxID=291193 RepID=A0A934KLZ9_9FLAO|nr:RagB/SusD family nutrient uptake outer membrane protein [Gelidibacter salicanalis]MBJ7881856.1 RagB/SusD family nutrient uptake outer membrane protein [Gelidibacter salicanalis]